MTKYSFELKLKIVQEYLAGKGGRIFIAQKYHIKNSANIFEWVTAYKRLKINNSAQIARWVIDYREK